MDAPHDDEDKASPYGLIASNVGLLGSFVLFLIVVMKILAVAHFNLTSALAITASAGTGAVILGALVSSFTAVVLLVFLTIAILLIFRSVSGQDETILKIVLLFTFAILLAIFPWYMGPLLALAVTAVFFRQVGSFINKFWEKLEKKGIFGKRARAALAHYESVTRHSKELTARVNVANQNSNGAIEKYRKHTEELKAALQERNRREQAYRAARWSPRRRSARRSMEEAIQLVHEKSAQLDADQK